MAATTSSFSADALRIDALRSGKEARVEVNQRLLIDKVKRHHGSRVSHCVDVLANTRQWLRHLIDVSTIFITVCCSA